MSRGGGDILSGLGCYCGGVLIGVASFCLWGLLADVANLPATPPPAVPVPDPYLLGALAEGFSTDVSTETFYQEPVPLKRTITLGMVAVAVLPLFSWATDVTVCSLVCSLAASRAMLVLQHIPEQIRPRVFIKPFPYRWQKDFIYVVGLFFARSCLHWLCVYVGATFGASAGLAIAYAALLLQWTVLCKVGGLKARVAGAIAFVVLLATGAGYVFLEVFAS